MKLTLFCATVAAACLIHGTVSAKEVYLTSLTSSETSSEVNDQMTVELVERQHGPYIGAWIGGATGGGASLKGDLSGANIDQNASLTGGLKLGYYFRTPYFVRPSIEIEAGYVGSSFTIDGGPQRLTGSGDFRTFFSTANLLLALDLGALRDEIGEFAAALHPYIGGGIGAAYSTIDTFQVRTRENGETRKDKISGGSKLGFAYQLMAGMEVDLGDDFSIFGEYKRLGISQTGSASIDDYDSNLWVFGCKLGY